MPTPPTTPRRRPRRRPLFARVAREGPSLRLDRGIGPGRQLLIRVGAALALVALVVVIFWFDRDQLRDHADGHVSLGDVVYFAMITISTVGYGDIVPVGQGARLIDAFVVTPVRIIVWLIFLGTAYQMLFRRFWDLWTMQKIGKTLTDHVVVCGYGHKGAAVVEELLAQGEPAHGIVVIEQDPARAASALKRCVLVVEGDATSDEVLHSAQIARARSMVTCLTRDDTTTLCVLSARHLNARLRILSAVRESENLKSVSRAGANVTIPQQRLGGFLLARGIDTEFVLPVLLDLNSTRGRWQVVEGVPAPDELGKSPRVLGHGLALAVVRDGRTRSFGEFEDLLLRADDVLVRVVEAK